MKNLKKLASIAIIAAFVAGCQPSSPSPVAVKKPDPTNPTPTDTTKKDTTKVVVIVPPPPTPVSPKVNAGEKCYEARVIFLTACGSLVVEVLNDSIGIKSMVGFFRSYNPLQGYVYEEKEYANALTLKIPDDKAIQLWAKTGKVFFTVKEFVDLKYVVHPYNGSSDWGYLGNCAQLFNQGSSKIALKGAILSSYSNTSCNP